MTSSRPEHGAFDFVSPADESVIRKFFIDTISQFSELTRKERGR